MKKLDKIALVDIIGRELQSRMTFSEIGSYFKNYGIPTHHIPSYNSKYVWAKEILLDVEDDKVLDIAVELEIDHPAVSKIPIIKDDDANFWKPGHFRLFISHLASFKETIGRLKRELEKFGISAFVAHEDIEPTKEWQNEIEKGLFSMDALCAVLMPKFNQSNWTDQEIGIAIGRGILVIPIRRGMDPYGFIGKYQGFQANGKNIGQVTEGLFKIISSNEKTRTTLINKLTELFLMSNSESEGHQRLLSLKKIDSFPSDKMKVIVERIVENKNLKSQKILKEFNEIIGPFGHKELKISDFEKPVKRDYDDLPF